MKSYQIILLFLAFVVVSCSNEQVDTPEFKNVDLNHDSLISKNEFTKLFSIHIFNNFQDNDDAILNKENYAAREYALWDTNDDELLSADEWQAGYENSYGDYVISRYDIIDVNGDNYIDYAEYDDILSHTSYYSEMDANNDSILDEDELSTAVFQRWDTNDDGQLQRKEYEEFKSYYFDN